MKTAGILFFPNQIPLSGKKSLPAIKSGILKTSDTIRSSAGGSVLSGNVPSAVQIPERKSKKSRNRLFNGLKNRKKPFLKSKASEFHRFGKIRPIGL